MKGKIVLLPFPFTDLTKAKLRPALIIFESPKDVIVTFISSKIPAKILDTDILLATDHKDFQLSGLKVDSVIKLDKIATILKDLIIGEIGEVGSDLKKEINSKLNKIIQL
ncbi:MAG: type II toxin-antitoxin system PemK/MazF family toxin [Candidatus Heimdallarchaeaceae archaeon]